MEGRTPESDNPGRNEDDENPHENSPESAGLARGLARSAVPKGAGRIAVGRLPLQTGQVAAKTSRVTSRVASRTRMARIQRVAKVSDRASTGFDFVEAHQEASAKKESWRSRTTNFAGNLAKNTILGMAVFATYEEVIDRFEQPQQQHYSDSIPGEDDRRVSSTLLSQHYAAGFCAGSVHAGLGSVIESAVTLVWRPLQRRFLSPEAAATVSSNAAKSSTAFFPNLIHHATSHAVLFGSYETVKRTAKFALGDTHKSDDSKSIEDESDGFVDRELVAVGLAGGTAGILQQIVSDVTEDVTKALQRERKGSAKGKEQQHLAKLIASIRPPTYSARSLLMLSIPTSIGFVAFEYGREAVMAD